MHHSEKAMAAADSGANITKDVTTNEQASAQGIYHITATGPVEWARERYCQLRDRLHAKGLRGWFDRLINGRKLLAEFLAIPVEVKWADEAVNIVVNAGKNLMLDTGLAGSAYTVTGPYMGLAGGTPASATATDTLASKTGWSEVGGTNAPAYTGTRKTCAWSAASAGAKALSSALAFAITSAGAVAGCFIVYGSGAVNTLDSTAGTLWSVGAFTGGSKTVGNGDTLNVSYSTSL
jgi:hypothetical protein